MREVSRANKALMVLLLDQSDSGSEYRVASYVNNLLNHLLISCSKSEGVNDYFDICVLGYHTRSDGFPVVAPALKGALSQKTIATMSDIYHNPCRLEPNEFVYRDEDTGELLALASQAPVWVEPFASGSAPLAAALLRATLIVDSWIAQHRTNNPPLVLNVTSGRFVDADPRPNATKLMSRATSEGTVLLGHDILLPETKWPNASPQHIENLATLFELSSVVPIPLRQWMCIWRQLFTDDNARCFAINGTTSLALDLLLASLDGEDRAFPHLTDKQTTFLESLRA